MNKTGWWDGRDGFIWLIWFDLFIWLDQFNQTNQTDQINKRNQPGFTPHVSRVLFSTLLAAKGLFGRHKLAFDDCTDRGQSLRRGGFKT